MEMVNLLADDRPLAGRTVLVTRARSQAPDLTRRVEELGGRVWEFPLIRFEPPPSWTPLDAAIAGLAGYDWVVLTSVNGVHAFVERLQAAGAPAPGGGAGGRPQVAAVGAATARALEQAGVGVDLVPPEFRGAALPGAMAPRLRPGSRVLMARGDLADPALAENLRALGARVDDVVAYRTLPAGGDPGELLRALADGAIDYVTLTSSSTVSNLVQQLGGGEPLARARIICIGPETEKAARAAGLLVTATARKATIDGLIRAMLEDLAKGGARP